METRGAPKEKRRHLCTACGAVAAQWAGQCGACGAWNTLVEQRVAPRAPPAPHLAEYAEYAGPAQGGDGAERGAVDLRSVAATPESRRPTGLRELDRVLGGGLTAGATVLIGGAPGIGKSTLLLQTMARLGADFPVLYVAGEESPRQISMRARRLGLHDAAVRLLGETRVERIIETALRERPQVITVDSIQTLFTEQLSSAPGAVAQVRESAAHLIRFAKQTGATLFLIGHVTKEGALAGPRVLEHMVDTVLYFEGEGRFRMVRALKNRFGAVNELGIFAMTDAGLKEVSNPSAIFLSRRAEPAVGSIALATREGTRPLLVELQALVDETRLAIPRRVSLGLDHNRMAMLLAILHRHGGVSAHDRDIFVNVAGGVRVAETASDLAVLLAIRSSLRDRPLPPGLVVFGEIGLVGEVRPVVGGEERLREAAKHGFTRVVLPRENLPKRPIRALAGLELVGVARLTEALDAVA